MDDEDDEEERTRLWTGIRLCHLETPNMLLGTLLKREIILWFIASIIIYVSEEVFQSFLFFVFSNKKLIGDVPMGCEP